MRILGFHIVIYVAAMLVYRTMGKRVMRIWFYYYAKLERHFAIDLYTNIAVSSHEWKPRIVNIRLLLFLLLVFYLFIFLRTWMAPSVSSTIFLIDKRIPLGAERIDEWILSEFEWQSITMQDWDNQISQFLIQF